MFVFLNGRIVPEEQAVISAFDRGFLFGDGLFETMRVCNSQPFRWAQHLERFRRGAEFLKIKPPFSDEALRGFAGELIAKEQAPDAVLRFTLSRGRGGRGYATKDAGSPTLVMFLRPLPSGLGSGAPPWRLTTSSQRLPAGDPLAQFKTCNKLPQILARAEAEAAGADEALLLNTEGFVVEGSGSNLFWIQGGAVCTSPLAGGILPGVTRMVVQEICRQSAVPIREYNISPEDLRNADGIFLSVSTLGIVEAQSLDGRSCPSSPIVHKLQAEYEKYLRLETA